MDLEATNRWVEYSNAKDVMFQKTDLPETPWWVVDGDDKRKARVNCIAHLLSQFDYDKVKNVFVELPKRNKFSELSRPSIENQRFIPRKG